ncbi:unnamed protein product [Eruca vesicaria subsp. sativa]|uniref:exoribonuclease II n=1 Tax=Eruca vesicaria subsp. sativa TaxID=29727 RepID=A0ABC8KEE3_ERUVS|nr:unnamed protein product [Eruca vesicaria subsp. sativa]
MSRFSLAISCFLFVSTIVKATDVKYCDDNEEYEVKVQGVHILPYPIVRDEPVTFSISANTENVISRGKLLIEVSYFGWHIHSETHDLCDETKCPVAIGDFLVTHSQVLPGYTPHNHMASFDGPGFSMVDKSWIQTKAIDIVSSTDISPYLSRLLEDCVWNGNRAIVFEVYWDIESVNTKSKQRLSSVKLSTKNLCLFLRLPNQFTDNLNDLYRFFASKFVTFVGVQIQEDLVLLKENHGIVIRSYLEIGKLAAVARGTPIVEFLGTRELAEKIHGNDMSRLDSIQSKWDEAGGNDRLEAAAIEGWLIYNVYDQLQQ